MSNDDIYTRVTEQILTSIDAGTVPWHQPWVSGLPRSMSTGKPYRGVNAWLLSPGFHGTYKKIKELGGSVRKGEKGSLAVFWKFIKKVDPETGVEKSIPFLRHFTVFHVSQADWPDGVPERFQPKVGGASEADRITDAEQLLAGYVKGDNGPSVTHGGDRACYRPSTDTIDLPELAAFHDADRYYSTAFHECGHSTGHKSRLARDGVVNLDAFGSHRYAREELVAEMTAAMLCAIVGIDSTVESSAAYLAHWRSAISDDNRLIVKAAGEAQKAADLIQGIKWEGSGD